MKIIVIRDKYYDNHILLCFKDFFDSLASVKKNGLIIESIFVADIDKKGKVFEDADWVITVFMTHELFLKLNKNGTKIAVFWDDVHYWTKDSLKNRIKMFSNCNILLLPYYKQFVKMQEFDKFWNKAFYFPWYAPQACFKFYKDFDVRKDQFLLSGTISEPYSMRMKLYKFYNRDNWFCLLKHPGYDRKNRLHNIIHEKYYEYLSNYKICFVTTADSPLNYTVAKYFEIPACGCALILQKTPDIDDLGFVENEHYISVNKNNFQNLKELVKSFDLRKMSKKSYELIKNRHLVINRIELLFEKLKILG